MIIVVFKCCAVSNPLHPDVFLLIHKMEAETVAMCLRMYNNPDGAGMMTSGSTESLSRCTEIGQGMSREPHEPEM